MSKNDDIGVLAMAALLLIPKRTSLRNIVEELPHGNLSYSKRSIYSIDKIVIHHSATTDGSPEAYANYHVNTRGWPGIGYHFVIQKDGQVFQTNYLDTVSYHTSGQNTRSIGICLTGNYDSQQPPAAQMEALINLVRYLAKFLGRLAIHGHNEFSGKTCPGNNINVQTIENLAYAV